MKIVKPNATYLNPANMSAYQFIEKIGRTCYKSENQITDDSAVDFVKMLTEKGHYAMLEHAYLYYTKIPQIIERLPRKLLKYINIKDTFMSASFQAMRELLDNIYATYKTQDHQTKIAIESVLESYSPTLHELYPEIFPEYHTTVKFKYAKMIPLHREDYITEVKRLCREDYAAEIFHETLPHTLLFTVNRDVTPELVRHRPASFGQESTRFCNYEKGKFGSEITVVEPFWAEDTEKAKKQMPLWIAGCEHDEKIYMERIAAGATAQEARDNLPNSTKADIAITTIEEEWEHIINLRLYGTTGKPHPDMKHVMKIAAPLLHDASEGRLYFNMS